MNDLRVISLIMGTVHLPDIALDVPQGVTVTIPANKAARSKDLWRLIAQKQLFRLDTAQTAGQQAPLPVPQMSENDRLREEKRLLEEQNRLLKQALDSQGAKLDSILGLLGSGMLVQAASQASAAPVRVKSDLVEIETPTYIPSEIKPRGVEQHVEVKSEITEGSGVAGAGAALRRLRKESR